MKNNRDYLSRENPDCKIVGFPESERNRIEEVVKFLTLRIKFVHSAVAGYRIYLTEIQRALGMTISHDEFTMALLLFEEEGWEFDVCETDVGVGVTFNIPKKPKLSRYLATIRN